MGVLFDSLCGCEEDEVTIASVVSAAVLVHLSIFVFFGGRFFYLSVLAIHYQGIVIHYQGCLPFSYCAGHLGGATLEDHGPFQQLSLDPATGHSKDRSASSVDLLQQPEGGAYTLPSPHAGVLCGELMGTEHSIPALL